MIPHHLGTLPFSTKVRHFYLLVSAYITYVVTRIVTSDLQLVNCTDI